MAIFKKKKNGTAKAFEQIQDAPVISSKSENSADLYSVNTDFLSHELEQDSLIKEIRENLLTEEDVRRIIAEEFRKIFAKSDAKPSLTIISDHNRVEVVEKEEEDNSSYSRVPFARRMLDAEDDLKQCYNELKSEALAYGLKSRLSNSGDTFRLHTKTYLKISVAGKFLKLYLALNPEDYRDSSIPFADASLKNMYKDIPFIFKVRSPLSLRRAKQLLADACKKNNLYIGKIINKDWISPLKDYEPQLGGKND